ncbi:hypothetical protein FPRO03_07073 [Fusarium proliferatum]|nr:hypothetical protein FPRO03_07073 [Fusarium proliferatum]
MSDPLSVAASIAGLISITVEAVKFLSPYVSAAKETPQVAAHVYSEVQSTQIILMGLQSLTKDLGSVNVQHAALIGVNQVVAVLTDGVLLYSELHKELQSLWAKDGVEKVPLRGRLQWVWKESTFVTLLNRLQTFKSSMTLVLMILQSDSGQRAKEHQEKLSNNVKVLLDSNDALSRRLMNIEDALDDQTIISRRMNILSLRASPSKNTSQQLTTQLPATPNGTETSLIISKFDFEDDLESSRVYRRAVRESMDFSFRSSITRSHNWSVFSGLSLSDISIISVIALPVYQDDITNAEHYDFGAPGPVVKQPLLIECLEVKLKLLTIPGMQRYFDKIPYPPDDFSHLWSVLERIIPLLTIAQALDPSLDIDQPRALNYDEQRELILWFAQFCHDRLDIENRNLITAQDLVGGSEYGIYRVISLISSITKEIVITGVPMNNLLSAKAQVKTQPSELRKLLGEQRQFVWDLKELLDIKGQLPTYMNTIFEGIGMLADVQINYLVIMEGSLLSPLADQKWALAFDYLLKHISIRLWMKEHCFFDVDGHYFGGDKVRDLLARCLDTLPVRAKRISALFKFSEYLKNQPIVTEEQEKDKNRVQSLISKIVAQLQDNGISRDTQAATQELQQQIEDWKGISPGDLGEMILSKTLYATNGPKTNMYHGYLFQNILLLSKETHGQYSGERSSHRSNSLSEQKQAKFILKGLFHLRHILSVTPISRHGMLSTSSLLSQSLIQADSHLCEVQWGADDSDKSTFSLVFALESEMQEWASKIDEYRMMAILMVEPKTYPEDLNPPMEGNAVRTVPGGLAVGAEPWK